MLKVIGLTVETYVGEFCTGHNCDFTYEPAEMDRYYIHVVDEWKHRYEIMLEEAYGECGSGWTTASWGYMEINPYHGRPFTHIPVNELSIDRIIERVNGMYVLKNTYDPDDEINNVFSYSSDGGDSYYPMGGVHVNMDLFKPLPRAKKKRPVYIVTGKPGIGKTTLFLDHQDRLETDSLENGELPNVITESIVIIGGKYPITIDEVKSRLFGEPQVIEVHMEEL